ncbi:MAG: hypothetical protein Q9182_007254 [Xanthomendoza sp. 2 TL-2023]
MFTSSEPLESPSTIPEANFQHLNIAATSSPPLPSTKSSKPSKPFPFFRLPPELRSAILSLLLCPTPHSTVDLSSDNHLTSTPRLNYFLVSKRFGHEAYHIYYSTHTFRIFQTDGRFLGKRTRPLLARLPRHYLTVLRSLEIRLGLGWTDPPKPWVVNDRLGLQYCDAVTTLKVFVDVDPSGASFDGFRLDREFYTDFCGRLLARVLERLPALRVVEFDAYPSVYRDGALMTRLLVETARRGKKVAWGREREWGYNLAEKIEMTAVGPRWDAGDALKKNGSSC